MNYIHLPDPLLPDEVELAQPLSLSRACDLLDAQPNFRKRRLDEKASAALAKVPIWLREQMYDLAKLGEPSSKTLLQLLGILLSGCSAYVRSPHGKTAYEVRRAVWEGIYALAINPIALTQCGFFVFAPDLIAAPLARRMRGAAIFVDHTNLRSHIGLDKRPDIDDVMAATREIVSDAKHILLKNAFFARLEEMCPRAFKKHMIAAWKSDAVPQKWRDRGRRRVP